jgi:hypothetical protein
MTQFLLHLLTGVDLTLILFGLLMVYVRTDISN